MNRIRSAKLFLMALISALAPGVVQACSVCYGDPDAGMSKGLTWGIAVLLGVVVTVLGGIGTFFVYLAKKSPTPTDKV